MIEQLFQLFEYEFFRNAVFASLLASLTCGIVGSYIVARRMVFISGGITHASFGGIGIAYFLGLNPVLGAAVFSVLSALGIEYISGKTSVREDSAIGILWSLGMALGIIFVFMTPGYAPNLMSYLFGSILTVGKSDLWLMVALSVIIAGFFMRFYHTILFIAFDEDYARSHRIPVNLFKYILISLVALTIVMNIRIVGIILVISFLTIPPSTANLFTNNLRKMMLYSTLIGIFGSLAGIYISYFLNIPSGATIIFAFVVIFAIAKVIQMVNIKSEVKKQMKG
ncbi:MAG: metal ABC transporter permease [Lentimicrobium sp.]|jgi:zinc transport system permease protein|nr:metal ABC transporter permease [Lentimicrobium sp.]